MPGQPQWGATILNFDTTALHAVETAAGALAPPDIVPAGTSFDVYVEFNGTGLVFDLFTNPDGNPATNDGLAYEIQYSIESIGEGPEGVLGSKTGSLQAGQNSYGQTETAITVVNGQLVSPPATPLTPGVYLMAATVRFPAFPTMVGYIEGTLLQIS